MMRTYVCSSCQYVGPVPCPVHEASRDCEHGHLRRSCERCDDAAEIERLQRELIEKSDEINSLSAQLNRMIILISGCGKCASRFVKSNFGELPDIMAEVQSLRDQLAAHKRQIEIYDDLLADDGK